MVRLATVIQFGAETSSDFDVRHSFTAAATYDVPRLSLNHFAERFLGNWSIDAIFRARTATPLTVIVNRALFGLGGSRADLVQGVRFP